MWLVSICCINVYYNHVKCIFKATRTNNTNTRNMREIMRIILKMLMISVISLYRIHVYLYYETVTVLRVLLDKCINIYDLNLCILILVVG